MFDLYENIKGLCEARGVSVSKMCIDIGVSKSLMSNIKNHRADTLSAKSVAKIADYLGVSYDCVMHGQKETPATPKNDGLDEERSMWANAWDNATPAQRKAALAVLMLQVPPHED